MKYNRTEEVVKKVTKEVELCDGCYGDIYPYPGNPMSKFFSLRYCNHNNYIEEDLVFCRKCHQKLIIPFFNAIKDSRISNGGAPR